MVKTEQKKTMELVCNSIWKFSYYFKLSKVSKSLFICIERIKTESARTSSSCWTKLCTKIIYTLLQAFVLLLQISYQKKSFLTTPNIENQSRSSAEFH